MESKFRKIKSIKIVMPYIFIAMKAKHFDEAISLWENSDEIDTTIGDSKDSLKKYLNRNPGMSFVCIEQKLGAVAGTVLGGHDGRRGYVYHLTVMPEHRGKSIGKKLLDLTLNKLLAKGITRCIVMVKVKNKKGFYFWDRNKWQKRNDLVMYSKNLK